MSEKIAEWADKCIELSGGTKQLERDLTESRRLHHDCMCQLLEGDKRAAVQAEQFQLVANGLEKDLHETRACLAALMAEFPNSHVRYEQPELWERCKRAVGENAEQEDERRSVADE